MPETDQASLPEREAMPCDVVIVGAGPAGLAAGIHLKQLAAQNQKEISVVILEKGSEVGAHILSGAVIDPVGLDALWPSWQEDGAPLETAVTKDKFYVLGPAGSIKIPNFVQPPLMKNHGNYIGSLGNLCRWLGEKAESLGVEIYPGFAATEILYDENGHVKGVATGDMGIGKESELKDSFTRGIELHSTYTLIAEGARGSLAKTLISNFELDKHSEPQKYGIGLKELWEVPAENHHAGLVQHTFGWPLDNKTGGGSFMYHFGENLVSVGIVVHLNYENPYISPYDEFQRLKTHPKIRETLEGGKRISYGARAITEGGLQSVPNLTFPGGALMGCAAGFVNVPRIKGSHNAILTGMMAAASAYEALAAETSEPILTSYQKEYEASAVYHELKQVRNVKPLWSKFGTVFGILLGGADMWLNTLVPFFSHTLKHGKPDHLCLQPAEKFKPISYPKPDGIVSFDKLSSVFISATNHEEDQPVHLVLNDTDIPVSHNLPLYNEPAQRYCPAGVYEIVEKNDGKKYFQINAQNCVHCKTCDIKDPTQNINWVPPEGGGGPNYPNM
ncbi:MAG: electron transfer flavoprotein-ubiquinone oxidoreductase [Pseudomonadota bacterium]